MYSMVNDPPAVARYPQRCRRVARRARRSGTVRDRRPSAPLAATYPSPTCAPRRTSTPPARLARSFTERQGVPSLRHWSGDRAARCPLPWSHEQPASARRGGTQASRRPAQGADRQPHGTRCLGGHHASGPQRVHLLGRRCQAGDDPNTPHPPHRGGAGRRPASALLLARVQTPRAHRQLAVTNPGVVEGVQPHNPDWRRAVGMRQVHPNRRRSP